MAPCQTKLVSYGRTEGLCFGAFGEASPDVHNLVKSMAEAGAVKHMELWVDRTWLKMARAAVSHKLYAAVRVASIRGLDLLKLERLAQVIAGSASGRAKGLPVCGQADRHAYYGGSDSWW